MKKLLNIICLTSALLLITACQKTTEEYYEYDFSYDFPEETEYKPSLVTYFNQDYKFSVKIPEKILSNPEDIDSLVTMNLYQMSEAVYFSSQNQEETIDNKAWDFRIGTFTLPDDEDVTSAIPFLQEHYDVNNCSLELISENSKQIQSYQLSPLNQDTQNCQLSKQIQILYNPLSQKLITYPTSETFFFTPQGDLTQSTLDSIEFPF